MEQTVLALVALLPLLPVDHVGLDLLLLPVHVQLVPLLPLLLAHLHLGPHPRLNHDHGLLLAAQPLDVLKRQVPEVIVDLVLVQRTQILLQHLQILIKHPLLLQ